MRRTPFGVEWNGTPLDKLLKQIPATDKEWKIGPLYERMDAGVGAGIPEHSRFEALNAKDKVLLIAFRRVKTKMRIWEEHLRAQEVKALQVQVQPK